MIVSMTGFGDATAQNQGTHYAVEVRSVERLAKKRHAVVVRSRKTQQRGIELRCDDGHPRARLAQQAQLALGHGATADDEYAAVTQIGEEREIAHAGTQPSSPWMPHSRFSPKKRVASASPASASVRVVCQSPIET